MPVVDIPWPDRRLHPNARTHWAQKAKAVREARLDSAWWARAAGFKRMKANALDVTLTFHPPDKRRRDLDSMLASMKSALDGIADVTGVDDSTWAISMSKGEPREGGSVRIEVRPA